MPALCPFGPKISAGLRDVVLISEPAVTAPETLTSTSPILYSSAKAPVATSAATLTRPSPTPPRNTPLRASRQRIVFLTIAHPGRIYPRAPRLIHHLQDLFVNRDPPIYDKLYRSVSLAQRYVLTIWRNCRRGPERIDLHQSGIADLSSD